MINIDEKRAYEISEKLLGRCPEQLERFVPKVGGDDSHSFRLIFNNEDLLLKVKKRAGSPVGIYFHSRIKEAGLPVPELVAFDSSAGPNGETCAIWEFAEGEPAEWGAHEECPYDEAEMGEILRRIHELRYEDEFGFLGDDPLTCSYSSMPDLGPKSKKWSKFFGCEQAAKRYFDKGYLTRKEADILSGLPERVDTYFSGIEPRLLHFSDIMHNGNVLVQKGRITAILDYVESVAGDPRWELAWFDYYFEQLPFGRSAFDMRRFRARYGTQHDSEDEVGRFYLTAILLFEKLLWVQPETKFGQWAIETVKQYLSEIGS